MCLIEVLVLHGWYIQPIASAQFTKAVNNHWRGHIRPFVCLLVQSEESSKCLIRCFDIFRCNRDHLLTSWGRDRRLIVSLGAIGKALNFRKALEMFVSLYLGLYRCYRVFFQQVFTTFIYLRDSKRAQCRDHKSPDRRPLFKEPLSLTVSSNRSR